MYKRPYCSFCGVLVDDITSQATDDGYEIATGNGFDQHFFAVLHKTTTWNHKILGFDDNVSIKQ